MQTFLPYEDFEETAKVLDYRRLGKQRVETKQILMTLIGQSTGWKNHPAVRMWRGYEGCLRLYGLFMCDEWIRRGYNDNLRPWFATLELPAFKDPHWMGDERLHLSHRSNLLRKDAAYYGQYWIAVPNDLPYWWPV